METGTTSPSAVTEAAEGRKGADTLKFVAARLVRLAVSLVVLISATFLMVRLIPGDPVRAALGEQATPKLVALERHNLGLDQSLLKQYIDYFKDLLSGDLGSSIVTHNGVASILAARVPNTLQLAIPAFILLVLLAVPTGYFAALATKGGQRRRVRSAFVGSTGVLNSIPDFVAGTLLSAIVAVWLRLLPVAGNSGIESYVLPVIALVIGPAATLSRIVRVEALKVMSADYVTAARARRIPIWLLHFRHILPNMSTASMTYGGVLLGNLVAGTVLIENVFAWPGVGSAVAHAVVAKDYPVIQGVLLVLGGLVLVINMTVDIVLGILDPRSRIGAS